jgi:hypothetical protein
MNLEKLEFCFTIAKFMFEEYELYEYSLEDNNLFNISEVNTSYTQSVDLTIELETNKININIGNRIFMSEWEHKEIYRKFKNEKGAKRIIKSFFKKNKVLTKNEKMIKDIIE